MILERHKTQSMEICPHCMIPVAPSKVAQHQCVAALREKISCLQSNLDALSQRYKDQHRKMSQRENSFLNQIVSLQTTLESNTHNYHLKIQQLEEYSNCLLEKVSSGCQAQALPRTQYNTFHFSIPRDEKKSLGLNVSGGKDIPTDGLLVTRIADGGPASRSPLNIGDLITSVNGQNLEGLSYSECIDLMRTGETGESVDVTIQRPLATKCSIAVQTDAFSAELGFNGDGVTHARMPCDLLSLSSCTDLESVGLSAEHEFADFVLSRETQSDTFIEEVLLCKKASDEKLGISLEQIGSEGCFIKSVENGSVAWKTNQVFAGDQILKINGVEPESVSQAAGLLASAAASECLCFRVILQRDIESVYNQSHTSEDTGAEERVHDPLQPLTLRNMGLMNEQLSERMDSFSAQDKDTASSLEYESPKQTTDSEHNIEQELSSRDIAVPFASQSEDNLDTSPNDINKQCNYDSGTNSGSDTKIVENEYENVEVYNNCPNCHCNLESTEVEKSPPLPKRDHRRRKSSKELSSQNLDFPASLCNSSSVPASKSYHEFSKRNLEQIPSTFAHSLSSISNQIDQDDKFNRTYSALLREKDRRRHSGSGDHSKWKIKIRPDGTRYVTRKQSSKSNSQNIYCEVDQLTTDDESTQIGKFVPKTERKKQLLSQDTRKKRSQGYKCRTMRPNLESVAEERVLTLSRKQQSKLKAKMLDGFVAVTEIMANGGASTNPRVSMTTL